MVYTGWRPARRRGAWKMGTRLCWSILLIAVPLAGGQPSQTPAALAPYTSCHFADGLQVVKLDPLRTSPMVRSVMTPDGSKQIVMLEGERIMFAYPFGDFYANVKVEELPAATFAEERQSLLGELAWLARTGEVAAAGALQPMQGFEVAGVDRPALKGGVLGTYLLVDKEAKVVTTIYFLNQDPLRDFHTVAEYQKLRDQFLQTYTSCVRLNQSICR